MKRRLISLLLGGVVLLGGNNVYGVDCKEEAKRIHDTLGFYLDVKNIPKDVPFKFNYEVFSVREVDVKGMKLCEVVFSLVPEARPDGRKIPVMKQIGYLGDDFMIFGDVRVKEGNKLIMLTQERNHEVNKEYFEMLEKAQKERSMKKDDVIKKFEGKEKELEGLVDVWLGNEKANTKVYLFVDPYCSYCERMKEEVEKFVNEGKLKVGLIFTGVLGDNSRKVVEHALCKKGKKERLKVYQEKVLGEVCKNGRVKAKKNVDYFMGIGARGVPYGIWYRGGKVIEVTEGYVSGGVISKLVGE